MIPDHITIEVLNSYNQQNLAGHLGIVFTGIGTHFVEARMPVNDSTRQPMGILHGGASAALAETLGSIGSFLCIDQTKQIAVGLEINANHVRSVKEGYVYGKAEIVHLGRKTHIWDIRIRNEQGALVCISRLTVAVLDK